MRRPGKISPTKVAGILGVHINTVHTWCKKAVTGEKSKLKNVERNPVTGYYWVDLEEVKELKRQRDSSNKKQPTQF